MNLSDRDIERFWGKVSKDGPLRPGMPSPCWEWSAGRYTNGYGAFNLRWRGRKLTRGAHRISWLIHSGRMPSDLYVLHRCDNPSCVNPEHLFLGTQADNMADMRAKNRDSKTAQLTSDRTRGENNPKAKFTVADVMTIKRLLNAGFSHRTLAEVFNCPRTRISDIALGRCWSEINPEEAA